jgi:hypothetical protein
MFQRLATATFVLVLQWPFSLVCAFRTSHPLRPQKQQPLLLKLDRTVPSRGTIAKKGATAAPSARRIRMMMRPVASAGHSTRSIPFQSERVSSQQHPMGQTPLLFATSSSSLDNDLNESDNESDNHGDEPVVVAGSGSSSGRVSRWWQSVRSAYTNGSSDGLTFRQRLAKMGLATVLSYGWVSNMSYGVTVSTAWYIFSKRVREMRVSAKEKISCPVLFVIRNAFLPFHLSRSY